MFIKELYTLSKKGKGRKNRSFLSEARKDITMFNSK